MRGVMKCPRNRNDGSTESFFRIWERAVPGSVIRGVEKARTLPDGIGPVASHALLLDQSPLTHFDEQEGKLPERFPCALPLLLGKIRQVSI